MKEYYTVGEVSKIFKVSTDALRFYDKIGLIKPWKTGKNGYRYYSKAQFEIISTVLLLRSLGTPIHKLHSILNNQDIKMIEHELLSYHEELDAKISELQNLKSQAALLYNNIKDTCYDEEVTVRELPRFWILSKAFDATHDELDIEEIVEVNRSTKGNWISFANIISTIDKERILLGDYHTYKDYGFISEYPCDTDREDLLEIIESNLWACCNAKVMRSDHIDIDRIYTKMVNYIEQNGFVITGDTIERNVFDLFNHENDPTIFFKIYMPISKK